MNSIYVNAVNCHVGGGKTLLDSFLSGLEFYDNLYFYIFVDDRYKHPVIINKNIYIYKVNKFNRIFVSKKIKNNILLVDKVLFFGNLPPLLGFENNIVYLLLSSRFYVDKVSFKGFQFKDILKIFLEKVYFNMFKSNVNKFIVQSYSMKNLLDKVIPSENIFVWPFENSNLFVNNNFQKEKFSFIYVASLIPYKNHRRLLEAWFLLKKQGLNPALYLTIDQNNSIKKWIYEFVKANDLNVIFLENISREKLISVYQNVEFLIYPSYFEAYGLPLIEAKNFNLKILCSDLDYCWEFISPSDFFNPFDIHSISRCVSRCFNKNGSKIEILSPEKFINNII